MCGDNQQAAPGREFGFTDVGCSGYSGATSGGMWRTVIDPSWADPAIPWRPSQRFNVRESWLNADVIVVSAGTNNALRQEPPQYLSWDVDNMMRLANGRRVVWMDVGLRLDVPSPLANAAQFRSAVAQDDVLWAKARQYPNLRVLAWGGEVGAHRDYVQNDGIPLTQMGWAARWRMVRDAIQS